MLRCSQKTSFAASQNLNKLRLRRNKAKELKQECNIVWSFGSAFMLLMMLERDKSHQQQRGCKLQKAQPVHQVGVAGQKEWSCSIGNVDATHRVLIGVKEVDDSP
ncbi:hypothetical protein DMENIID0001_131340 [Sergentomyia squamirostris]